MADHFPTRIFIGGPVKRSLIPQLIQVINVEDLQDEWGRSFLPLKSEDELLKYTHKGHLYFCDEERLWGAFELLEKFLVEKEIPFDRSHSPRYETSGEIVQFRKGMKSPAPSMTDATCTILVYVTEVQKIRDRLKCSQTKKNILKIIKELDNLCSDADIEPLPKFEIVD